jgi:hypothetical protein
MSATAKAAIPFLLENGADPTIIDAVGFTFEEFIPAVLLSSPSTKRPHERVERGSLKRSCVSSARPPGSS